MYHYVTQLKTRRKEFEGEAREDTKFKYLDLLIKYIKITYITITTRLTSNLKNDEIIFDLLPFLFQPNKIIYTTILDAQQPACFRYKFDKETITDNGIRYFYMIYRYLNFNGVFSEALTTLRISIF